MILVLNIGLKNARVIVFDFDGCVNSDISFPVRTSIKNDCVEQNPDHWIRLTEKLLEGTIHQLKGKVEDIKYITITTSALCLVAIDKNGTMKLRQIAERLGLTPARVQQIEKGALAKLNKVM